MKKFIIALIIMFLLQSCTRSAESAVNGIEYFKDNRTNLCFAKVENSSTFANNYSLTVTCVPCENVNHLLTKQ